MSQTSLYLKMYLQQVKKTFFRFLTGPPTCLLTNAGYAQSSHDQVVLIRFACGAKEEAVLLGCDRYLICVRYVTRSVAHISGTTSGGVEAPHAFCSAVTWCQLALYTVICSRFWKISIHSDKLFVGIKSLITSCNATML